MHKLILVPALSLLLAGCAASGQYGATPAPTPAATPNAAVATEAAPSWRFVERQWTPCSEGERPFDCDRRAILAMVGEFKVDFAFDETVVLAADYERRPAQRSGGFETVVLIEDAGERIELQHILVVGKGHVVKHWRQTWQYEADPIWRFEGGQRYRPQPREAGSVAGSWTQSVYEVSDAPRYAGSGRWNHKYGVSTWTSDRIWRPLPRRDYSKRDDYQLLNVENRHTITPQGWTHEQDNTKVQRNADGRDRTLVREFGFNDYRRIRGYDFSPGYAYWEDTGPFWAEVRQRWNALLKRPEGLVLNYPTDDEDFIGAVLEAADGYRDQPDLAAAQATLDRLFAEAVQPAIVGQQAASSSAAR